MPSVIRYGQKPKAKGPRQWSQAEILQAFWEMEEELTGKPSPMKRREMNLQIPELRPQPIREESEYE